MHVYIGGRTRYLRGHGVGGTFKSYASSALRAIKPYAKEAAMNLGRHAIRSGTQVFGDILQGQNVGESLRRRGTEMGWNYLGDYGIRRDWAPMYNYGYDAQIDPYGYGGFREYRGGYPYTYSSDSYTEPPPPPLPSSSSYMEPYSSSSSYMEPPAKRHKGHHKKGHKQHTTTRRTQGRVRNRRPRDIFGD